MLQPQPDSAKVSPSSAALETNPQAQSAPALLVPDK
jgi:hypothetical protein